GIGVAVRFPSAEGTHVRRGDADLRILRGTWRRTLHEFRERLGGLLCIQGISRAGMRRLSLRGGRELIYSSHAELFEFFIFQKAGGAQRVIEVLLDLAHLNLASNLH